MARLTSSPSTAERPRVECLFPQLGPVAAKPRLGAGLVQSRPELAAAGLSCSQPCAPVLVRSGGSVLSAATASELPASLLRTLDMETMLRDPAKRRELSLTLRLANAEQVASAVSACAPPEVRIEQGLKKQEKSRAVLELLPYPGSVISSAASGWRHLFTEMPSLILTRGLLRKDVRYCTETSLGVCILKQDNFPQSNRDPKALEHEMRLAQLDSKIMAQEEILRQSRKPRNNDLVPARVC